MTLPVERVLSYFLAAFLAVVVIFGFPGQAFASNVEVSCEPGCFNPTGVTLRGEKFLPGSKASASKSGKRSGPVSGHEPVSVSPSPGSGSIFGEVPTVKPPPCPIPTAATHNGLDGVYEILCQQPTPTPPAATTPPTPPQLIDVIKKLPLDKPDLKIQPHDVALAYVPEIAYTTTPQHHTYHTTLFNQPVTVTTHTTQYQWHWGNGTTTTSPDGGHPYPNQTVTYTYTQPGNYTIQLTTVITATYTNPNGVTHDIPGTATLTSNPQHLHIKQQHTVLVSPR